MTAGDALHPRLIIPAPEDARRDQEVVWYEIEVSPPQSTARIAAFGDHRRALGVFEVRLLPDAAVSAVVSDDARRVVLAVHRGDGDGYVAGEIDGRAFTLARDAPDDVQPQRLELEPGTDELLRPWRALRGPLAALRQATADEECTGCLLLGATVVQAAELCVGGDAGACGALIDAYDFFRDICDPPPCH
jgi:hypothetical protein